MIKLHFVNVGHGDCNIIEFVDSNRIAVIDINKTKEMDNDTKAEFLAFARNNVKPHYLEMYSRGMMSFENLLKQAGYSIQLQDPISYFDEQNIGNTIFRFISTHPHMDHISGLNELYNEKYINNFWVVKNNHSPDESKLSEDQKKDWQLYKKFHNCKETKYENTTIVRPTVGDSRDHWNTDQIEILAPNSDLIELSDKNINHLSYVLLITYGPHKIIYGGDAEKETWEYIMDTQKDKIENITILNASHHGRDSGYYQPAVKHMSPTYTIVSVGKKPSTDASNKYRQYCDNVWSTRWKGNIRFSLKKEGGGSYETQHDR